MPRPDDLIDSLPPFSTQGRRSISNTLPDASRRTSTPLPPLPTVNTPPEPIPSIPIPFSLPLPPPAAASATPSTSTLTPPVYNASLPPVPPTTTITPSPSPTPSTASKPQVIIRTMYMSAKNSINKLLAPLPRSTSSSILPTHHQRHSSRRRRHHRRSSSDGGSKTPGLAILALTSSFFVLAALIIFRWLSYVAANIVAIVYVTSIMLASGIIVGRHLYKKWKGGKKGGRGRGSRASRSRRGELRHQHRLAGLEVDDNGMVVMNNVVGVRRAQEVEDAVAMDAELPPYSPPAANRRSGGDDVV